MKIQFERVCDVKLPSKAYEYDAGIDFYLPNDFTDKDWSKSRIILHCHDSILIKSGIKMKIPHGYVGVFLNKSSIASKLNILIGAQVVDSDYQGEIHFDLHNTSRQIDVALTNGMKIAQMLILPVPKVQLIEKKDLFKKISKRGGDGFGSTAKF